MVRDFFLRGYRRSGVKLLGANIRSLSTLMAQVNHGVPDNDSRFLYKIGIVLFKTKKHWWVFSRVLSQNVKSVLLHKNLLVMLDTTWFFSMASFQRVHLRTKSLPGSKSRPTASWKNGSGAGFPSFPNATRCSL